VKKLLPVLVVALSLPSPAHAAEPGSGFASYGLTANAPGFAVEGLYRDVAFTVPETTSTLSTGGVGAALATIAWPGPILGNLGTTILVLSDQAPPQVTALNDPVRAEARSGGTQKSSYTRLPGTDLEAAATTDTVTASSHTGSQQLPVGTVGSFSGDTQTSLASTAQARGTARGLVHDVALAGGVIRIGSVTSTAEATTDGVRADGKGTTTVTGMTVAGVPVTVDEDGLHVAGQGTPLATQAVTDAVKALGLTAVLTQPRVTKSTGSVSVTAGALVLMYSQGASTYAVTLGRSAVGLTASPAGSSRGVSVPPLPFGPPPAGPASLPRSDGATLGSAAGQAIPPSVASAQGPLPAVVSTVEAAVVALSHGASGLATAGLLLAAGLLVAGMRRLPDKVLAVSDADCEEWPS
jgi:hypothetical protein